jgi:hypothetical protein
MSERTEYDITIDPAVRKYAAWRASQPPAYPHRLSVRMTAEQLQAWRELAAAGDEDTFAAYVRNVPELITKLTDDNEYLRNELAKANKSAELQRQGMADLQQKVRELQERLQLAREYRNTNWASEDAYDRFMERRANG